MLQQTQVTTVVPYFERFLARFPDLRALAAAGESEVLRYWQGLGYYARARNLHRAAQRVVREWGGVLPTDEPGLRSLPGIGRYMAGAIRSFAFGESAAIVEANSGRVLTRLVALVDDPTSGAGQRQLWSLAEWLTPHRDPATHNQAIMELGALVCTPGRPRCGECPLASQCQAQTRGLAAELPRSKRRPAMIEVRDAAAIVWKRGRVLIARRPSTGRWGGLWEFPRVTLNGETDAREPLANALRSALGVDVQWGEPVLQIQHVVTHHRIRLTCYHARHMADGNRRRSECGATRAIARGDSLSRPTASGFPEYVQCRWVRPAELGQFPFSTPQRKVAAAVAQAKDSDRLRAE
jgi:A/G-specific adenine glycosylase